MQSLRRSGKTGSICMSKSSRRVTLRLATRTEHAVCATVVATCAWRKSSWLSCWGTRK